MFIPGETIVHRFNIPFITSDIAKIIVSYREHDHVVFEREPNEISTSDGQTQITVNFTQKESLLFADCTSFLVQLNVLLADGTRCASKEIKVSSGRQHIREEVTSNA